MGTTLLAINLGLIAVLIIGVVLLVTLQRRAKRAAANPAPPVMSPQQSEATAPLASGHFAPIDNVHPFPPLAAVPNAPAAPAAPVAATPAIHTIQPVQPVAPHPSVAVPPSQQAPAVQPLQPQPSSPVVSAPAHAVPSPSNGAGAPAAHQAPPVVAVPSPPPLTSSLGVDAGGESTVHIGVLGCGYWGSKHVRVLSQQPGVTVTAIDRDIDRLDDLRSSFQSLNTTTSLETVMHQIDGLVIATPATSHAALAMEAISNGVHVLVEKPLATSVVEAERLVAAAEQMGVTITVGHTFEFNPAVWALRDVVHDERFGKIQYIDSARLNLGLYQPDVNVLWDLAPHDISIVLFLLDAVPTSVCTWASSHVAGQREDVAYLQMRFDQLGITANVHVSWLDPAKVRRTTVVGSRRMAVYNDMSNERIRIFDKGVHDQADPLHQAPITYREGDILSPYVDGREPLGLEAAAFVDAVRGTRKPVVDGRRGLNVVRVLEAAELSAQSGGIIDLAALGMHDAVVADVTATVPQASAQAQPVLAQAAGGEVPNLREVLSR